MRPASHRHIASGVRSNLCSLAAWLCHGQVYSSCNQHDPQRQRASGWNAYVQSHLQSAAELLNTLWSQSSVYAVAVLKEYE